MWSKCEPIDYNKWKSVCDYESLPKPKNEFDRVYGILVTDGNVIDFGFIEFSEDKDDFHRTVVNDIAVVSIGEYEWDIGKPTHWMPLPKPPREG